MSMRLHLGCGFDRRDGYINVDSWSGCHPDLLVDLDVFPWPFGDNSITQILARHVIEHLAPDFKSFAKLWREIYRISAPDCEIDIAVPYYKSNEYWSDPSHVRVYSPLTFSMLSLEENKRWQKQSISNTVLAMQLGVDFQVLSSNVVWQAHWQDALDRGEISSEQLFEIERDRWNVIKELQFKLLVKKS